jgi:hypothetical protein
VVVGSAELFAISAELFTDKKKSPGVSQREGLSILFKGDNIKNVGGLLKP